MGRGKPRSGETLAERFPLQAAEWHPTLNGDLRPTDVTPRSNRKVWWECSCGEVWEAIIGNRTTKQSLGCRSCSRKRVAKAVHAPKTGASLTDVHPRLAAELHPTLNADHVGTAIHPGSHTKVWWLCPECGNEFEMAPRRRTASPFSGCPPCAYRRIGQNLSTPADGESLHDLHPELATEWHPTLNAPTGPGEVSHASGFHAWWRCREPGCGHEWRTAVANRSTGKRSGCPMCSRVGQHLPAPGESFAELHPHLLAEWHPTLNTQLDPMRIKPGSSVSAWWLCGVCGHEWETTVGLRVTAGTGCWPCSYKERGQRRRAPQPQGALADLYPGVVVEWDWDANAELDPAALKPGSDLIVWWRCQRRGHRWQAHIYARTGSAATGCPDCVHLPDDGSSFADVNPDIALEWHPTLNGDRRPGEFKPGSAYRAWWQCLARGHEWQVSVANRNGPKASACPTCTMWGTSATQVRIAYELVAAGVPVVLDHPKIAVTGRRPVAADIVVPDNRVVIEYDGSQYHAAADAFDRDCRQTAALTAAGWTVVRIRPKALEPTDQNCVQVPNNATIKQITDALLMKLADLEFAPAKLAAYLADTELWATGEADRAVLNLRSRSLLEEFADVAAEWHPTRNGTRTPRDVNPGSKIPVWWLCRKCGHEWRVRPGHRTSDGGTGCPRCAAKTRGEQVRAAKPGNSMAEVHPHLLRIFHPAKNGDLDLHSVNAGTTRDIWWLCPDCGHEWKTKAARNSGCRPCASKRRGEQIATPAPGGSLADLHPMIASQWHPTKNGDLLPSQVREGYAKLVWWLCPDCGRAWQRTPGARVANGSGCRRCSAGKAGLARRTPNPGESLADTHPQLAAEWIIEKNPGLAPNMLKANSLERAWWKCAHCKHEWNAQIDTRALRGYGCKRCAAAQLSITQKRPKPGLSLADAKPERMRMWHPRLNSDIQPQDMKPNSHTRVWWLCPDCGYEWQATPGSTGCRPCSMKLVGARQAVPAPGRSLLERFPEMAKQWDVQRNSPLSPAEVAAGSNQYFWWVCRDCNHHWRARPSTRINSVYLCPACKTTTVRG
jgi:transposase-like protein